MSITSLLSSNDSLHVYRLRDACATLRLVLLANHSFVADYVEESGPDLVAASGAVALTHSPDDVTASSAQLPDSWVYVGVTTRGRHRVYVVLPTYAALFFDMAIEWAFFAHAEMSRQYAGRCIIAKLQTVGGGWASLHRADKALLCALQLHCVAEAVFEEEVVRKCRLFIGWAHLWNSNPAKALTMFRSELADARRRDDIVHERRCLHAISNAEHNPHLAPGGAYTNHFDLVDFWARSFG